MFLNWTELNWFKKNLSTHSENQDVLLLLEGADGLVGDPHADKEPLILGSHHCTCGLHRAAMVNKLYLLYCRERGEGFSGDGGEDAEEAED